MKKILLRVFFFKLAILLALASILFLNPINPKTFNKYQQNSFEKATSNWDVSYYLDIAESGYKTDKYSDKLVKYSFYPGQPLVLSLVLSTSSLNSYYFIYFQNILVFMFLAFSLYKYLDSIYPDANLRHYIFWTYLLFPFSYFFHIPYTEAIFMALTFLSLYYLEQHKIFKSNIIGLFLGFFKVTALVVGLLNVLKFIINNKPKLNKQYLLNVFSFILFGVGTVVLFGYFYLQYGDFFLFFKSQQISFMRIFHWDFFLRYIKEVLYYRDLKELFIDILAGKIGSFNYYYEHLRRLYLIQLPFILVVISSAYLFYKKRFYDLFFAWLLWIIPMTTETASLNRYLLQSFPFIFAFSELCYQNKFLRITLPIFYILGFTITMVLFSYNYWVG